MSAARYDTAKYRRTFKAKKRVAGLCLWCDAKRRPSSSLCDSCTRKSIDRQKARAAKLKAQGYCARCLKRKPDNPDFRTCTPCLNRVRKTGRAQLEKVCRGYGITADDYERLLAAQGGKCAICGGDPNGRWKRLDIDHDHQDGRVLGLLCHDCNKGLGCFRESGDRLAAAIRYLIRTRKNARAA
jgi:hypothetical protein